MPRNSLRNWPRKVIGEPLLSVFHMEGLEKTKRKPCTAEMGGRNLAVTQGGGGGAVRAPHLGGKAGAWDPDSHRVISKHGEETVAWMRGSRSSVGAGRVRKKRMVSQSRGFLHFMHSASISVHLLSARQINMCYVSCDYID